MQCFNTFTFEKNKFKMQYEVRNEKEKTLYIILYNASKRVLGYLNMAHLICSSANAPTDNRELTVKKPFFEWQLEKFTHISHDKSPNYHFHQ